MDFNLKATQTVIEVRFRPNLAYYDTMFKIAASLEADYEDWGAQNNPSQVTLLNNETKTLLSVASDRLAVMTQSAAQVEHLETEAHRLFSIFINPSEITEIRRLGIRITNVYSTSGTYSNIVDRFHNAFYPSNDTLKDLGADEVEDVAYILDSVKDGAKNRIRIGPLKKEQLATHFNSQFKENITLTKDANLLIDIDVFDEATTSPEASEENLDVLFATSKTIFDGHLNYCKEQM